MATRDEMYHQIMNFINNSNIPFSSWYIGISSTPRETLFSVHNVDEQNGRWMFFDAESNAAAKELERSILDAHKINGSLFLQRDVTATNLYVYAMTVDTIE